MRGQLTIFALWRLKNFLMREMIFYRVERRFANLRNSNILRNAIVMASLFSVTAL